MFNTFHHKKNSHPDKQIPSKHPSDKQNGPVGSKRRFETWTEIRNLDWGKDSGYGATTTMTTSYGAGRGCRRAWEMPTRSGGAWYPRASSLVTGLRQLADRRPTILSKPVVLWNGYSKQVNSLALSLCSLGKAWTPHSFTLLSGQRLSSDTKRSLGHTELWYHVILIIFILFIW